MTDINIKTIAESLGKNLDIVSNQIKSQIRRAVKQLSLNTYNEAQRIAMNKLKSSREDYLNALKYEDLGDVYIIYLDPKSERAIHLEKGWAAFDMKPGLLNGPNSKMGKNGRYNTVPFRHKSSEQRIDSTGQKVLTDTAKMIQEINKQVKKGSLSVLEKNIEGGKIRTYQNIENPRLAGLTRISKTYTNDRGKETTQHRYFTFRRVSENSDENSWRHPGYRGVGVFPELENYVQENINRILQTI